MFLDVWPLLHSGRSPCVVLLLIEDTTRQFGTGRMMYHRIFINAVVVFCLLPDYSRDGHDLMGGIGGGVGVAAVVLRQLRGVGYPGDGGDAAGDDLGVFSQGYTICGPLMRSASRPRLLRAPGQAAAGTPKCLKRNRLPVKGRGVGPKGETPLSNLKRGGLGQGFDGRWTE